MVVVVVVGGGVEEEGHAVFCINKPFIFISCTSLFSCFMHSQLAFVKVLLEKYTYR